MLRLAFLLGALGLSLVASRVGASGRDEDLFVRPEDHRTVLFGSLDAGRSVFVSGGAKQSLTGPLDRTGFILSEVTGFGFNRERFRTDEADLPALRLTGQQSVLVGHQWNDGVFGAAMVGPELTQEQLTVAGRVLRLSEARLGLRVQGEVWVNPTPDTMVTANAVGSSSLGSIWARGAAGYRVWPGAFLGPEITAYATQRYQELRVGAHVTGATLWRVQTRISAGWMTADDGRADSGYFGLSVWMRL